MTDTITVSTTSTRVVHTFQVDFKGKIVPPNVIVEAHVRVTGLEDVERRLKCDDGVEKKLTRHWTVCMTIVEVRIYVEHQEF